MGIGRNGYYTLKDILKEKATYNWIISDRNDGKSFAVKKRALERSIKAQKPLFALIRRNEVDIKPSKVERYFVDRNINLISEITKGEYDHVKCRSNYIYLAGYDENGREKRSPYAIGEYYALSTALHEKSTGHICEIIIAEEMLTDGQYLDNEPSEFMHLVSTLCRSDSAEVYMIGNTINRICPYFKEWGMKNIFKQESGTIDTYWYKQLDGTLIKICCERVKPRENKKSNLFIGKAEKSIQGGEWQTQEFPKLWKKFEDFDLIDSITYISPYGVIYTIALIIDDNGSKFCFVYPAKHISERVLTSEFSENPLHTPRLKKDRRIDISIHNCYIQNKFLYSDNLTGTDFTNSIKAEKLNPFLG